MIEVVTQGETVVKDCVLLMPYEWVHTYSEPMNAAPIAAIREVLEQAVKQTPPEKILLGIPNYGYDWPLPYVKGLTRANSISNEEAIKIAQTHSSLIKYDETVQAPHFQYIEDEQLHEVWFEDERSIQAKRDLTQEYGLYGMVYWNQMRPFGEKWLVLSQNFSVIK